MSKEQKSISYQMLLRKLRIAYLSANEEVTIALTLKKRINVKQAFLSIGIALGYWHAIDQTVYPTQPSRRVKKYKRDLRLLYLKLKLN